MKVNIFEAKNRLSELVQRAAQGEEVIIANRGKPMVKLIKAEGTIAPLSEDNREAEDREWDTILAEMDRIPDRPDAYDPFDWDEIGLDK